jgi:S-methylmethionine-dependent homocysteine/selenocysteine methylase
VLGWSHLLNKRHAGETLDKREHMARYRNALPQLAGDLFLTDGGIETTLIFHEGLELPDFAAFHLLRSPEGEAALYKYFRTYAEIAGSVLA